MSKPTGWKEKYLQALAEHEQDERRFKAQMDLMRKTFAHLSAAANGLDSQLDHALIGLKEKMRGAGGQQVLDQMEKVQQAVKAFEDKRGSQLASAAQSFKTLCEQLTSLQLDNETHQQLRSYTKNLHKRLHKLEAYSPLIHEFTALQAKALAAAANPEQSFWQRLRGRKTLQVMEYNENVPPSAEKESQEVAREKDSIEEPVLSGSKKEQASPHVSVPSQVTLDLSPEDSMPAEISQTLEDILNHIEPAKSVQQKVIYVRECIENGITWQDLPGILENMRDILLQGYAYADEDFSDYLLRVNEELHAIRASLGVANDEQQERQSAVDAFESTVSKHVLRMQESVSQTSQLDELKSEVNDHIAVIQEALLRYQTAQTKTPSLTEQLQSLVERVHSVESESHRVKVALEEQRHRATHDPLTQLPNREAYNERAHHELQRFNRYQHPLTMAVCDIDFFKKINDTFGHQAGDKVLKVISQSLSSRLRKVDFVARYGGEEFVVLMPETTAEVALQILDKIRDNIASTPFRFKENPVQITLSFGIAGFKENDTIESVFARADQALYKAKEGGRNQCVLAGVK